MIEFRVELLFGLAILAATWLVVYVIGLMIAGKAAPAEGEEGRGKGRKTFSTVMAVVGLAGLLLWCVAVVWTGWRAEGSGDQAEELVETPELDYQPTVETLEDKREDVRERGEELQREGKGKLDDFRKDFFNRNEADESEATE
jgi:hypothetical protein